MGLNSIKIYFGKVVDLDDSEKLFRVKASIIGYTDQIEKENLSWYYPWYGINFLPKIGDEIPIIIFNNEFAHGFYTKKANNNSLEVSDDDYKTYLEIYKREDDKVTINYQKSKGIVLEYDKAVTNIDKDKIISKVTDNAKSILTEKDYNIIINSIQFRMEKDGFILIKDGESLKKIMVDLIEEIEKMKFKNTVGQSLLLINKPMFIQIKNRVKKFFSK